VFQNTNMLYHELKGHYFLYLSRHGSWERLRDEVLERPIDAGARDERPRRRAGMARLELAFDRSEIDARLASIDAHTLRPRYQSDLIEDEDRARFDRELAPERPSPSVLVHDRATGEIQCFSPAAAALLERCDGSRTLEEVVEIVPHEARGEARRCLIDMAKAGLFERPLAEVMR
jgi:hypothetical protein